MHIHRDNTVFYSQLLTGNRYIPENMWEHCRFFLYEPLTFIKVLDMIFSIHSGKHNQAFPKMDPSTHTSIWQQLSGGEMSEDTPGIKHGPTYKAVTAYTRDTVSANINYDIVDIFTEATRHLHSQSHSVGNMYSCNRLSSHQYCRISFPGFK